MKRVYIAGPMSGITEHNFPTFHAEAVRLRALGYEVVNPAEINALHSGVPYMECVKKDIAQMVLCDTVVLLPGWEKSRGVGIELRLACDLEMGVVHASSIKE